MSNHGTVDHHHHHHHHGDHVDYAEHNREHFNKTASEYESKELFRALGAQVVTAYRDFYQFDESKTVVLDFACGTGKCWAPTATQDNSRGAQA